MCVSAQYQPSWCLSTTHRIPLSTTHRIPLSRRTHLGKTLAKVFKGVLSSSCLVTYVLHWICSATFTAWGHAVECVNGRRDRYSGLPVPSGVPPKGRVTVREILVRLCCKQKQWHCMNQHVKGRVHLARDAFMRKSLIHHNILQWTVCETGSTSSVVFETDLQASPSATISSSEWFTSAGILHTHMWTGHAEERFTPTGDLFNMLHLRQMPFAAQIHSPGSDCLQDMRSGLYQLIICIFAM